jgi:serine/threonine protein kinase
MKQSVAPATTTKTMALHLSFDCDSSTGDFMGLKPNCQHHLDQDRAKKVAKYVSKHVAKLLDSQEFKAFQEQSKPATPTLSLQHSQVQLGRLLGKGAFSDVYEIKKTLANDDIPADRFVVKVLRERVLDDPNLFAACAVGLAKEGAILASLHHEHIVHVRGVAQSGVGAYATGRNDAFFLVLDRLEEMLSDRLLTWAQRANHYRFYLRRRHEKFQDFFYKRLQTATDLANAVSYLHQQKIVHRDLKPSNVGFTRDGTLKLFDFDVARILPEQTYENECFKLTKATGTRRYMSPECGLGELYNCKADVYSFALLLHEILSLQHPFIGIDKESHSEKVFRGGLRPLVHTHNKWPIGIKLLLKQSWSSDIHSRPCMSQVHERLTQELSVRKGNPPTSHTRFGRRAGPKVYAAEDCMSQ